MISQIKKSKTVNDIIIATSIKKKITRLETFVKKIRLNVFQVVKRMF